MVPKRSKRRRTTNPSYATCDRTDDDDDDDGGHEVQRQMPNKAKPKSTKQQIAPNQQDGIESLVISPPSSSAPSRVQNLDREKLKHQSDTAVLNVESQPSGMNPTSPVLIFVVHGSQLMTQLVVWRALILTQ